MLRAPDDRIHPVDGGGRRWVICELGHRFAPFPQGAGHAWRRDYPCAKTRDVLRLWAAGLSKRKIAASLGISATAAGTVFVGGTRGVVWPLLEGITAEILEARLYPAATAIGAMSARRPRPD